jgi:hypothetical protein
MYRPALATPRARVRTSARGERLVIGLDAVMLVSL